MAAQRVRRHEKHHSSRSPPWPDDARILQLCVEEFQRVTSARNHPLSAGAAFQNQRPWVKWLGTEAQE